MASAYRCSALERSASHSRRDAVAHQFLSLADALGRRSHFTQLVYASVLLLPWLVGIALVVVQLPFRPYLQLSAIGYAAGMWRGRRKAGL